jgi:DNA uptake protein ComE-like DNA-binding protein
MKKTNLTAWLIARERRGMLLLLVLVLILSIFHYFSPWLAPVYTFDYSVFSQEIEAYRQKHRLHVVRSETKVEVPPFDVNTVTSEQLVEFGLPVWIAERWVRYREAIGSFESPGQIQKIYGLDSTWFKKHHGQFIFPAKIQVPARKQPTGMPGSLFRFDPNVVTDHELRKLGFSDEARKAILAYRQGGGRFQSPEDLSHQKGITSTFYSKVEPYIIWDTLTIREVQPVEVPEHNSDVKTIPQDRMEMVDINNSNVFEWQMLKGIGPGYAQRIVGYREKLGGFSHVDQVRETYRLPDSVFQAIRPFLRMSPVIHKIEINEISVDSLQRHPYISWKQASVIVNYRSQHGPYTAAEDLLKTRVLDSTFVSRIKPYLRF